MSLPRFLSLILAFPVFGYACTVGDRFSYFNSSKINNDYISLEIIQYGEELPEPKAVELQRPNWQVANIVRGVSPITEYQTSCDDIGQIELKIEVSERNRHVGYFFGVQGSESSTFFPSEAISFIENENGEGIVGFYWLDGFEEYQEEIDFYASIVEVDINGKTGDEQVLHIYDQGNPRPAHSETDNPIKDKPWWLFWKK
jgi:hypothetical protein